MLLDANVLLYAFIGDYPQHARARDWLSTQLRERRRLALPWPSMLAFVRIATNHRILATPLKPIDAWNAMQCLLDAPGVWIATPGAEHRSVFDGLLQRHAPSADLVMDASLAALAIEHGLGVVSTDTDFARFPEVRWINPLA